MRLTTLKLLAALALGAASQLALADEPPARVGRVALVQGPVSVSPDVGEEAAPALINLPLTSGNQITTGNGGRAELRIGSTALRLDADSSLDIVQLDDQNLRLHLHYGSINVRVRSGDVLEGFDLSTPHSHIRIAEPGRLRIDTERVQDTTAVNVFEGVAKVDSGGSVLIVRAGKRAELRNDDVLTGIAQRDSFDDWAAQRDARDARIVSERYVTTEMTGYEDLDQAGAWRDDVEYGPLWAPRNVPVGWAPYRDGRWTWVAPWGWTWVDNAPWGYAPFHYGRWVEVDHRWFWAPGRNVGRPVWSPALVGWVGGAGWNLSFSSGAGYRQAPAQGWYPLAPREVFVPTYHVSAERLHYINRFARPEVVVDVGHHAGLTVVPHEQFGHRGQVLVSAAPRATLAPQAFQHVTVAPPPTPVGVRREGDLRERRNEVRPSPQAQYGAAGVATPGVATPRGIMPGVVAPAAVPGVAGPTAPHRGDEGRGRAFEDRRDGRGGFEDRRAPQPVPSRPVVNTLVPAPAAPAIGAAPQQAIAPAPLQPQHPMPPQQQSQQPQHPIPPMLQAQPQAQPSVPQQPNRLQDAAQREFGGRNNRDAEREREREQRHATPAEAPRAPTPAAMPMPAAERRPPPAIVQERAAHQEKASAPAEGKPHRGDDKNHENDRGDHR